MVYLLSIQLNDSLSRTAKTYRKTVTGTTSASGALLVGMSLDLYVITSIRCTSATNTFGMMRGDLYMTVFNVDSSGNLHALQNTEVTFEYTYVLRNQILIE